MHLKQAGPGLWGDGGVGEGGGGRGEKGGGEDTRAALRFAWMRVRMPVITPAASVFTMPVESERDTKIHIDATGKGYSTVGNRLGTNRCSLAP